MKKIRSLLAQFTSHALARNSAIVFVGSMVANVFAYLYHLFVGRILGPVAYGELTAVLSLFFILNVPSQVMQTVLVRYFSILYARNEVGQARQLFSLMTRMVGLACAGLGFFFALGIPFLATYLHIESHWYFVWLYIIFVFSFLSIINGTVLLGFQKFTQGTGLAALGTVLRMIFGVPAAFFGVGWALVGNALANLAGYIAYFLPIKFLFAAPAKPVTISKKSALSYSLPTLLATVGMTGLYTFDILYVKHYFSAVDAGFYSSATVLGKIIFFATSAVGTVLFPVISARAEKREPVRHLILYATIIVGGISFGLVAIYFLFPGLILDFLFGQQYRGAIQYLGSYGLYIAFIAIDTLLVSLCLALGRTAVWVVTVSGVILQFILTTAMHATLYTVLYINIGISAGVFAALFIYYLFVSHFEKSHKIHPTPIWSQ